MSFRFKADIYKVGINPCVKVPARITDKMTARKGYIPVKGTINGFEFYQTLTPVKDDNYRLYVNMPMLAGGKAAVGDTASFTLEQDEARKATTFAMPAVLRKKLKEHKLLDAYKKISPGRQKEVNKYFTYLRSEEAITRNVEKLVAQLKNSSTVRIP